MSWYLTSQNNNLFNSIYSILISVYNGAGQGNYNQLLTDALATQPDLSTLDLTINQSVKKVLRDLRIDALTPVMQEVLGHIIATFKNTLVRPVQQEEEDLIGLEEPIEDNPPNFEEKLVLTEDI